MHDKDYIHFDLKSDNILYKIVDGKYEPRIIDFGVMHKKGETFKNAPRGAILPPEYRFHESYEDINNLPKAGEDVDVWAMGWYAAVHILGLSPKVKDDSLKMINTLEKKEN